MSHYDKNDSIAVVIRIRTRAQDFDLMIFIHHQVVEKKKNNNNNLTKLNYYSTISSRNQQNEVFLTEFCHCEKGTIQRFFCRISCLGGCLRSPSASS